MSDIFASVPHQLSAVICWGQTSHVLQLCKQRPSGSDVQGSEKQGVSGGSETHQGPRRELPKEVTWERNCTQGTIACPHASIILLEAQADAASKGSYVAASSTIVDSLNQQVPVCGCQDPSQQRLPVGIICLQLLIFSTWPL